MITPRPLSAEERKLVARVENLVARERTTTVDLLLSLNELEDGSVHSKLGFSSLWAYCISGLRWSNGTTGRNFAAAKLLRRFPTAARYLREGRLNCSTFLALKDVLTVENHVELLNRASHLTEEKVAELVVTIAPKPIPPETLRRLPVRATSSSVFDSTASVAPAVAVSPNKTNLSVTTDSSATSSVAVDTGLLALNFDQSAPAEPFRSNATLEPLQRDAWLLKFPIDLAIKTDLEEVQSLLSHALPKASLGDILVECIRRTRIAAERQKYGVRAPARKQSAVTPVLGVTVDNSVAAPGSRAFAEAPTNVGTSTPNVDGATRAPISGVTGDASTRTPISGATDDGFTRAAASGSADGTAAAGVSTASTGIPLRGVSAVAASIEAGSEAPSSTPPATPILGVNREAEQARNRLRAGDRPPRTPSRPVKRAVAERDGRCCQYVGANGQKCGSKYQLEFDHWRAYAFGGEPTVENVRILCKSHNLLSAVELFGEEFMSQFVRIPRRSLVTGPYFASA